MWTINSISIYYHFFSDVPIVSSNSAIDVSTIVLGIIFAVIKCYLFYYQNKWKDIVKEFDKLPKNQNRIGSVIVLVVVLILIANLIFSISLLSQVKYD